MRPHHHSLLLASTTSMTSPALKPSSCTSMVTWSHRASAKTTLPSLISCRGEELVWTLWMACSVCSLMGSWGRGPSKPSSSNPKKLFNNKVHKVQRETLYLNQNLKLWNECQHWDERAGRLLTAEDGWEAGSAVGTPLANQQRGWWKRGHHRFLHTRRISPEGKQVEILWNCFVMKQPGLEPGTSFNSSQELQEIQDHFLMLSFAKSRN